jgi:predicted DNA-binding protein (UPF0251 family)
MMAENSFTYGVITGDIVRSSNVDSEYYLSLISRFTKEINTQKEFIFRLEFYRGDSFQALFDRPTDGFWMLLLMKSFLRSHMIPGSDPERALDARMSLGLGDVTHDLKPDIRLGEMNGSAFFNSGRTLDHMKENKQLIQITTGIRDLDDEFKAVCPMVEVLCQKWSINQAEAVYLYLMKEATQEQIGKLLGISQRSVGKRLNASHIEEILIYNHRYKQLIEWKYSN